MKQDLWNILESNFLNLISTDKKLKTSLKARMLYWSANRAFCQLKNIVTNTQGLLAININLCDHCNLNCKGCSAFSPLSRPKFLDINEFEHDLSRLGQLFDRVDQIKLVGGEPLLHPQINDFINITRQLFPKSNIILITNGILLPRVNEDFWLTCSKKRVNIRISKYPINLNISIIKELSNKYGIPISIDIINYFFKFYINPLGDTNPRDAFAYCRKLCNGNFLYHGRIYPCPKVALSPIFSNYFNIDLPIDKSDSIDIYTNTSGKEVLSFLEKPIPWCKYCKANWLPGSEWKISDCALDEWVKKKNKKFYKSLMMSIYIY